LGHLRLKKLAIPTSEL